MPLNETLACVAVMAMREKHSGYTAATQCTMSRSASFVFHDGNTYIVSNVNTIS